MDLLSILPLSSSEYSALLPPSSKNVNKCVSECDALQWSGVLFRVYERCSWDLGIHHNPDHGKAVTKDE